MASAGLVAVMLFPPLQSATRIVWRALGSVTKAADMRVVRMAHAATPLPDGRVLVLSGFTNDSEAAQGARRQMSGSS